MSPEIKRTSRRAERRRGRFLDAEFLINLNVCFYFFVTYVDTLSKKKNRENLQLYFTQCASQPLPGLIWYSGARCAAANCLAEMVGCGIKRWISNFHPSASANMPHYRNDHAQRGAAHTHTKRLCQTFFKQPVTLMIHTDLKVCQNLCVEVLSQTTASPTTHKHY